MDATGTLSRAWVRLPSGRRLDLVNPDPGAWTDDDLAIRLARTYRWGGESAWSEPLSVAQHSLLVLEIRRARAERPLTPAEELQELLHDAEEAFLGFDCISPLKALLGEPFRRVEHRLSAAVRARYGVEDWDPEAYSRHKAADVLAAASEAVHCVGWSREEVGKVLGIRVDLLDDDPLHPLYGDDPWKPWPAVTAAARFLERLQSTVMACMATVAES